MAEFLAFLPRDRAVGVVSTGSTQEVRLKSAYKINQESSAQLEPIADSAQLLVLMPAALMIGPHLSISD
jgi:hypothetical protein